VVHSGKQFNGLRQALAKSKMLASSQLTELFQDTTGIFWISQKFRTTKNLVYAYGFKQMTSGFVWLPFFQIKLQFPWLYANLTLT